MKDDRTSDDASIDEERIKVSRQVDLANNVQARYASPPASQRLSAKEFDLSNGANEGSKILFEISLGLRC